MTRLSVERLEEIRARVVRWASVPFAMSGTLADYVKKANEAHTWPGAERDEEHVAEAESWAEMIGDDPVVGVLVDALRLANRDRADLLAELDAVRALLAEAEVNERKEAAIAAYNEKAAEAAETERDDLQARLLVMTRERDDLVREYRCAECSHNVARAETAEAQREELAAALEHLRDVVRVAVLASWPAPADNEGRGGQTVDVQAFADLDRALSLPTSEAATTARRGWEAKGLELAAKVASDDAEKRRTAGDGFDGYTSSSSIDKATALYALASTLRDMAQKRQGGGT